MGLNSIVLSLANELYADNAFKHQVEVRIIIMSTHLMMNIDAEMCISILFISYFNCN